MNIPKQIPIIGIIRIALESFIIYKIYHETGIATTLFAGLVTIHIEYSSYKINNHTNALVALSKLLDKLLIAAKRGKNTTTL